MPARMRQTKSLKPESRPATELSPATPIEMEPKTKKVVLAEKTATSKDRSDKSSNHQTTVTANRPEVKPEPAVHSRPSNKRRSNQDRPKSDSGNRSRPSQTEQPDKYSVVAPKPGKERIKSDYPEPESAVDRADTLPETESGFIGLTNWLEQQQQFSEYWQALAAVTETEFDYRSEHDATAPELAVAPETGNPVLDWARAIEVQPIVIELVEPVAEIESVDVEVQQLFEELVLALEVSEPFDATDDSAMEASGLLTLEHINPEAAGGLSELVEAQAATYRPPEDLAELKDMTRRLSAEQLLVYLSLWLTDESGTDATAAVKADLRSNLENLVLTSNLPNGREVISVKPELLKQLLFLLRTVGHEHPKEALAALIRGRGPACLLQLVVCLSQAASHSVEGERQKAARPTFSNRRCPVPILLGRLVVATSSLINTSATATNRH